MIYSETVYGLSLQAETSVEIFDLKNLAAIPEITGAVHDVQSGARLFLRGDRITPQVIKLCATHGVKQVALLDTGENTEELFHQVKFREMRLDEIEPGSILAQDLHTRDGKLLLTRGVTVTDSTLSRLRRRGIMGLYVKKEQERQREEQMNQLREALRKEKASNVPPEIRFDPSEIVQTPRLLTPTGVENMSAMLEQSGGMRVSAEGDMKSLLRFVQFVDNLKARPEKTKQHYVQLYRNLIDQTTRIFNNMRGREPVRGDLLIAMTEQVVNALVADRMLLLGVLGSVETNQDDYLAMHAINTSVLAVNIAATQKLSPKQVAELGYGALLADVGMLSVPDAIRFKKEKLDRNERLEVMRHTLYGIDRLQQINYLPKIVPLVAYQSHERLDGSGYPHGKKSAGIHDYAKITAVADVYNAQVAKRPFRSDRTLPYKAVEELLRMVSAQKLDSRFVRGFLSVLSLFPVGSWVRLSSGEQARVIGANQQEFTKPVVAILYDSSGAPCPARRVDLNEGQGLNVVAPIRIDHSEPLSGF
jgi:HD-GYP domain-containing protein (c-di-GMP phosphodiesterase class II)